MFKCSFENCKKSFSTISNLNRHKKHDHELSGRQITAFDYDVYSAKCLECRLSFRYISDLRDHNWRNHKIPIAVEHLEFSDDANFNNWKNEVENESKTDFIKTSGNKKGTVYYYCSRTARRGKQIEKRGKRLPKLQGNKKLSFSCTCQMKVSQTGDGRFKVTYFKTHYGHEIEIEHTRLSKDVRRDIARKLASGVCAERILNIYRDGIGLDAKRSDFLTRHDIRNIRTAYNLCGGRKISVEENDQVNFENWLRDCSKIKDNPILFYKGLGEIFENFDENDILLVIMNKVQRQILQRFPCEIVSIERTRNLDFTFHLTTLMMIDDSGESFPVAFLFSNRKDNITWKIFFRLIHEKIGVIKVRIFMADDDCYRVWMDVMGYAEKHFYSPWHVDYTWRENLSMVIDLERRCEVYGLLRAMQKEKNEDTFYSLLFGFIRSVADNVQLAKFREFFYKNFFNKANQWAACFQDCDPAVVTRLENMQKLIRDVWMENGRNLGSGVNAILMILREKVLHRLRGQTKRQIKVYLRGIQARHKRAVQESLERVTKLTDWIWKVSSYSINHSVVKNGKHECSELQCTECCICCCCYQCNCADFCLKSTICKHIHMVALKERRKNTVETVSESQDNSRDYTGENQKISDVNILYSDTCKMTQ